MVKINKVYAAYTWQWNIPHELCGICQQGFDRMCADCKHPIECSPVIGVCDHSFHQHCINHWVETNKDCPMCRVLWKCVKIYRYERE